MNYTNCGKCHHPRVVHQRPLAMWNTGVGGCKNCVCSNYNPTWTLNKFIHDRGVIVFSIIAWSSYSTIFFVDILYSFLIMVTGIVVGFVLFTKIDNHRLKKELEHHLKESEK